ncbi:MAG: sigma-54 dependent transcriptional regulator [Syntrophales bacterium]|nr:sigma-54 dependent transcriptional regulator [Syntrophales bacterium]
MARILIVDDDKGIREFLEIMLTGEGYEVFCAAGAKEALDCCRKRQIDLMLTDLKMPGMDGIGLIKEVREISPETITILITAYASGETALAAMKEGVYDYVEKSFEIEELKEIVRDALKKRGIRREDAAASIEDDVRVGNIIGKSREMQQVYAVIKKIADTPASVMILGESGTGKELVAGAIHNNSSRRNMPFVVVNCGGIPENLLESEFFGYMKGAFTGAYADKHGLFEAAHKGTIFLDEISELPPLLQVKLLRVVQEKTFRRVGGTEDIKVDVRIISATNQDLEKRVREGLFREDLFFRLNVIPIRIPPLRERKEDIQILTRFFIDKYSREFGKEIRKISAYAMELLLKYPFPGNVRELENIIERSVALETSSIILPENIAISGETENKPRVPADIEIPDAGIMLNREMAEIEKSLIRKALEKANGSKTRAADLLGISRDSLNYRIEKLGII